MIVTLAAAAATEPPAESGGIPFAWWIVAALVIVLAIRIWWSRRTHPRIDTVRGLLGPRSKSSAVARKWGSKADRKQGVATSFDILRRSSAILMWKRGPVVRPSLRTAGRWQRLVAGPAEVAVRMARVGLLTVWASLEDVTIVFGGPRTGKTAWLSARIIDFPGMLVVTSTRPDIFEATSRHRSRYRPVLRVQPVRDRRLGVRVVDLVRPAHRLP